MNTKRTWKTGLDTTVVVDVAAGNAGPCYLTEQGGAVSRRATPEEALPWLWLYHAEQTTAAATLAADETLRAAAALTRAAEALAGALAGAGGQRENQPNQPNKPDHEEKKSRPRGPNYVPEGYLSLDQAADRLGMPADRLRARARRARTTRRNGTTVANLGLGVFGCKFGNQWFFELANPRA